MQAYLSRLLETHDFEIVSAGPLNEQFIGSLEMTVHDILLIDWREDDHGLPASLLDTLTHWDRPVLFNDTTATEISLLQGNPAFGQMLAEQISVLLPDRPQGDWSTDTA